MKVSVDNQVYDYEQAKLMLSEAYALKNMTGLTAPSWQRALSEFDPQAVAWLVWLVRTRSGEKVEFGELDFDLGTVEILDAPQPEGEPVDPTQSSGRGKPARAGAATR